MADDKDDSERSEKYQVSVTGEKSLSIRERALMATLCVAQVLEVLGVTVVIVALPAIAADLGLRESQVQLVVSLYAVLYGSLLLFAGRISDLIDRRTFFAIGLALGLAGALLCALATSPETLFIGRPSKGSAERLSHLLPCHF